MKVEVVSREGESQTLEIQLSPEEVDEEFKRAFNRYRKSLVVPGFRKGKAPNGLLRRKFGVKIEQEVREALLKAYSLWAMDEQNINLIDTPKAESLVSLQEGKPFSFRLMARANVVPAVRGYDRLYIRIPPVKEVTDEELDETLELLRKRYATLKPVEGPEVEVSVSDRVTVDAAFLGREDGKVLISAADERIEVQSAETMLFGQRLVGRRPGEEVIADYTVPDDFPDEKLRGNQVRASIKIKEIKKLELPPLDDSLAKIVGEGQTLAGLCDELRVRLRAQYEEQFNERRDRAVFERLLENNPIDVHPKILKTRLSRAMVSMIERGLFQKDSTEERYERMADSLRPIVLDTVKYEMLMAQVALQEGITAAQEDIEQTLRHGGLRPKADRDDEEYLVELFELQLDARKRIIDFKTRQFLLERLEAEFASDSADEEVEDEETSQEQSTI